MKKDQYKKEFLPKEIVLKLRIDIPTSDYNKKIELIKSYSDTIKETFDKKVFEVRLHNEIGFCYWEAGEFSLAILHFQKVIDKLKPQDYPSLYFLVIGLLIRCNRLISDFPESYHWIEIAFKNIFFAESPFDRLNILHEYVDVLIAVNKPFNYDYNKIIEEVIADLGFPEQFTDPVETIISMRNTNLTWNRKLSEITLMQREDKNSLIRAYENYMQNCPIGWYKNDAKDAIDIIKNSR
jgi:tetratricopeptide (TPR) repeat protein